MWLRSWQLCECVQCSALNQNDFVRKCFRLSQTNAAKWAQCAVFVCVNFFVSNFRHPIANDDLPNRFFVFIGLEIGGLGQAYTATIEIYNVLFHAQRSVHMHFSLKSISCTNAKNWQNREENEKKNKIIMNNHFLVWISHHYMEVHFNGTAINANWLTSHISAFY